MLPLHVKIYSETTPPEQPQEVTKPDNYNRNNIREVLLSDYYEPRHLAKRMLSFP